MTERGEPARPGAALAIGEERRDDVVVLRLAGELDMAGAPVLLGRVAALIAGGNAHVILDLEDLSFCDSAGLNAFIRGDRHCARVGGWLRLTGAQGHVARVIELSGVRDVLGYRPDAP